MVPEPSGPYPHFILAYYAFKFKAHKATLNFISTQHPAYEITQVYPSFVIGKNELASSTDALVQGSNALLYSLLLGGQGQMSLESATVHVDDVAYTHVKALDPTLRGIRSFFVRVGGWKDPCGMMLVRSWRGASQTL